MAWLLKTLDAGGDVERTSILDCVLEVLIEELSRIAQEPGVRYVFETFSFAGRHTYFEIPTLVYTRRWLESLIRGARSQDLDALFQDKLEQYPILHDGVSERAKRLKLEQAERRLLDTVIPRGRSLRDLLTISPLNRRRTLRLLFVLEGLGFVCFQASPPEDIEVVDPADALANRLKSARDGHYEALGLHITAHPDEFDEALRAIRDGFGSRSKAAQHSSRTAELCRHIVATAEEAHRFLLDRNRRMEYRRERHTRTELIGYAQLLIDKLKIAILREEGRRATQLRDVAMELAPNLVRRELMSLTQGAEDDEGPKPG